MVDMMLDEVDRYVCDEQKLVTYGWASRQLNVPSNIAKRSAPQHCEAVRGLLFLKGCRAAARLLFQYSQAKGDKVAPMYYVSGKPKGKPDVAQEAQIVGGGSALEGGPRPALAPSSHCSAL